MILNFKVKTMKRSLAKKKKFCKSPIFFSHTFTSFRSFIIFHFVLVILETSERDIEFRITSNIDGYPIGKFVDVKSSSNNYLCEQYNYHGKFDNYNRYIINWTVPDMENFEISTINITFT